MPANRRAETAYHIAMSAVDRIHGLKQYKKFWNTYLTTEDVEAADQMIELSKGILTRALRDIREDATEDSAQRQHYLAVIARHEENSR